MTRGQGKRREGKPPGEGPLPGWATASLTQVYVEGVLGPCRRSLAGPDPGDPMNPASKSDSHLWFVTVSLTNRNSAKQ